MLGLTLLMAVGVLGGWAPARRYFKDWSRVMVGTVIVAAIVFLVIWGVIPITE